MPGNGNAASFATLVEKVDTVKGAILEMRDESRSERVRMREETRIERAELIGLISALNGNLDRLAAQVQANVVTIARLQERQTVMAILTSTLAVVLSSIAAWLGMRK